MNCASAAVEGSRALSARAWAKAVSWAAFAGGWGEGAAAVSCRAEPHAADTAAKRLRQSERDKGSPKTDRIVEGCIEGEKYYGGGRGGDSP
jgi:hypothetical protein